MTVNEAFHPALLEDNISQKELDISRLIHSLKVIRDFLANSPIAGIN